MRNISLNTAAHKEIVKGDNIKLLTKVYLSRIERILEELSNTNEDTDVEDICPKDRIKQVITVLNAIGNCLMTSDIRDSANSTIFNDYVKFLQAYHVIGEEDPQIMVACQRSELIQDFINELQIECTLSLLMIE